MSLFIDLTDFLHNPMRTGIQRVSGELCRYLPKGALVPVKLEDGDYLALPTELIGAIGEYFRDSSSTSVTAIRKLGSGGKPFRITNNHTLLVPDIFDESRARFFRAMKDDELSRCRFFIHDLLPLTHPEFFLPEMAVQMGGYFQTIRRARHCAFNSSNSKRVYWERLKRQPLGQGAVIPLGADALGPKPKELVSRRPRMFSVLGTIEPRKNHRLILDAFEPLFDQVQGLSLHFIGKAGVIDTEIMKRVNALAENNSSFQFHSAPDDGFVREQVERSRATIYVSSAEGFGLPPVESLWLGTPVIASSNVPALEDLKPGGVHCVPSLTPQCVRQAVVAFLDDNYAFRKIEETRTTGLPTWKTFAEQMLEWCSQG